MRNNGAIKEALLDTFVKLAADATKVPSARLLAKTAGVGLSSVYYHFHSLEHLAFSAVTRQVQRHFEASMAAISATTADDLVEDIAVALDTIGNDDMLASWFASACTSPEEMIRYATMLSQSSAKSIDEICRRYQLPLLPDEARVHVVSLVLSMCIMRRAANTNANANANIGPLHTTARAVAAMITGMGSLGASA